MPSYVRIVHHGRGQNVRVELPDGSSQLVNVNDLPNWTQVDRDPGAQPFTRTRRTRASRYQTAETAPADRRYVLILNNGRGHHVRLLLPDGTTYMARADDLPNWTYVGGGELPDSPAPSNERPHNRGFVNPADQADRIYESITRRCPRNTTLRLPNGNLVHVPNELMGTWLRLGSSAYIEWDEANNYPDGREMHHLTFGVELEFIADPAQFTAFCEAMANTLGSGRFNRPDPNHLTYGRSSTSQWYLGYDRSVHPTVTADQHLNGYELTSPILGFDEASKQELRAVLQLITNVFKGKVNSSCGTHVHVGNFTRVQRSDPQFCDMARKFQRNYGLHERNVFDRLVSPSRRGNQNHYCKSCNRDDASGMDRYQKLNIRNLFEYNGFDTFENRQHQGTLELLKIWSWMELNGRYMIQWFKNPSAFDDPEMSMPAFFNKIGLSEDSRHFFYGRDVYFRARESR